MVFFTCSYCGESVKKPSVEKHYIFKCKNKVPFLTCVDCLKDFKGNEHEAHTKCMTEEERYSAKGFVPKPSSNKGERKQKAWSECAHGLLSSGLLEPDERSFLEVVAKFDNLPRKKAKFINFLKNTARQYLSKHKLIDRVWEKLENYFKECNSENQKKSGNTEDSAVLNGKEKSEENVEEGAGEKVEKVMEEEEETKKKKKKKRKKDSVDEEKANEEENEDSKKRSKTNVSEVEDQEEPKRKKSKKSEEEAKNKVDEKENIKEENEDMKKKSKPNVGEMDQEEPKRKKSKKSEEETRNKVDEKENIKENGDIKKKSKTNVNEMEDQEEPRKKKSKKSEAETKSKCDEKENVKEENEDIKKKNKTNVSEVEDKEEPKRKKSKKSEEEAKNKVDEKENIKEEKKTEENETGFHWEDTILNIISTKGDDNQIPLKKLQKKVLNKYCKIFECEVDEKITKKFMKKLKKMTEVTVNMEYVSLNTS